MNITDIKIRRTYQDSRLRALVSLTFDGELAVHDIKVIEGPERLFVAMPSRRDDSGIFRDIAHPITAGARRQIEDAILDAYKEHIASHTPEKKGQTEDGGPAKEFDDPQAPEL
jgi:stage V sporulation protein G